MNLISPNPSKVAEQNELFELLKYAGLTPLVEGLQNPKVFSAKGRIKKTTLARSMNVSLKQLELMFLEAREIVGS